MIKNLLTKNLGIKLMAISLAVILWVIARFWMIK